MIDNLLNNIKWLGHASFRIIGNNVIYIDPWKISDSVANLKGDIILITHGHYDHLSNSDIDKLMDSSTQIVIPKNFEDKIYKKNKILVKAGDKITLKGIGIEVYPAYTPTSHYHPLSYGGVGYVIITQGVRIYHAGDTGFIPEFASVKADIALLPIGGKYTMDYQEAAKAAQIINPSVVIPMHYNSPVIGLKKDAENFIKKFKGRVELLD